MTKQIHDIPPQEQDHLFPIYLTENKPHWKQWYSAESKFLQERLPNITRISHMGSTSIGSIWAKPIIDILVEIPQTINLQDYKKHILSSGYAHVLSTDNRIYFNKGYTANGFADRVFHLHLRHSGDNGELYFRDYLIDHPQVAKEYEQMKLKLWKQYEHDRDGYTNAKAEFVLRHTELAKHLYKNRY